MFEKDKNKKTTVVCNILRVYLVTLHPAPFFWEEHPLPFKIN